jgi:hypothetical protein
VAAARPGREECAEDASVAHVTIAGADRLDRARHQHARRGRTARHDVRLPRGVATLFVGEKACLFEDSREVLEGERRVVTLLVPRAM